MLMLMVGDVHGDIAFAHKASMVARDHGIKQIVQLGDFGIWDHTEKGAYFLDSLNKIAEATDTRWLFIPGNHENYDRLEHYEARGNHTAEDFVPVRDLIFYSRKVNSWEWGGKKFKAVGGAYSIDKEYRTPGKSWWPQEQLTEDQAALAADLGHADVLLTHDCPPNAPFKNRLKPDLESVIHRQIIGQVGADTNATIWFHGHMHDWYDYWFRNTKVYGLECNDNAMYHTTSIDDMYQGFRNMVIFDTETMKIGFPVKGV